MNSPRGRQHLKVILGSIVLVAVLFFGVRWLAEIRVQHPGGLVTPPRPTNKPQEPLPRVDSLNPASTQAPINSSSSKKPLDLNQVFAQLESKFALIRKTSPKADAGVLPKFVLETKYGLRELRLLSLAYPGETLERAKQLLKSPSEPVLREYALHALGYLSRELQDPRALALLSEAADSHDFSLQGLAITELGSADATGSHLDLFLRKCQEGVIEGYDVVSRYPNAGVASALERIHSEWKEQPHPKSMCALAARDAAIKIRLLTEGNGSELKAILSYSKPQNPNWVQWALDAAVTLKLPDLAPLIHQRIGHALRLAKEDGDPEGVDPRRPFPTSVSDNFLDDLLVAYWRVGGQLSEWEKTRLREFGYACAPQERLNELLEANSPTRR